MKRRIPPHEVAHVLSLARQGLHQREIARRTGVSRQGVIGITDRASITLTPGKRGPIAACKKAGT